ncbi:MAG: hypothetical protein EA425_06380 [Puniceicoccaceae bacterium]|nr:MAG: hypothetical protein EA425_06380 [Puniceicoccaceae bacterium]
MTPRALVLGFLAAAFLAGFAYFNDWVMEQTYLIGSLVPVTVYGGLILIILLINPLLARLRPGSMLSGPELAIILALATVVSVIPGSGLMRYFPLALMMPHYEAQAQAGGQGERLLDYAPERLLADPSAHPDALPGFIQGLGVGTRHIGLADIPWAAWTDTLSFWLPLLLVFWCGLIGLALMFHPQWARHEHLPYPIARITHELLPGRDASLSPLWRNRWFLIALAGVILIHGNNFIASHFPQWIEIRRSLELYPILNFADWRFRGAANWNWALNFTVFFSVVGISYFLPRQISLSIALAPILYGLIAGFLGLYGYNLAGGGALAPRNIFGLGAFAGIFLAILYTGRHFYFRVCAGAVGLRRSGEAPPESIWGLRVFAASFLFCVAWVSSIGLPWGISLLVLGMLVVTYVVMSRIFAETGLFMIQIGHTASAMLLTFFGARALGPEIIMITGALYVVFLCDPREALMPCLTNALKLLEDRGIKPARFSPWAVLVLIVGLVIAVPATLFWIYDGGMRNINPVNVWIATSRFIPDVTQVEQVLLARGQLEEALDVTGWSILANMKPNRDGLLLFIAGMAAVLLFTFLRLRFLRWPLHPLIFAIWVGWGAYVFAMSFFIGWLVKSLASKYGGESGVNHLKPFMIGLIAGEFLAALFAIMINWGYYYASGESPPSFIVIP